MTHLTHFIYGYMDIWATLSDKQHGFFYMHHSIDRIACAMAFVTPVVEHWLEWEIAQWVHHDGLIRWVDALQLSYILLHVRVCVCACVCIHMWVCVCAGVCRTSISFFQLSGTQGLDGSGESRWAEPQRSEWVSIKQKISRVFFLSLVLILTSDLFADFVI